VVAKSINYDTHIHTEYCGHAESMTVERILRRAGELGLDTICIADHIYSENELAVPTKIKEEVAKVRTNCRIIVGAEIDVSGAYCDGSLAAPPPRDIDYIIAAIHYIPGSGDYLKQPVDNYLEPQELLNRWRTTLMGVLKNPSVKTLAHPGRMIASAIDLDLYFDRVLDVFREAAPLAASNNIMWELNEHDKDKLRPDYFDEWHRVYEIALDAGVKLIYGSDSHFPHEIAQTQFVERLLAKLPANCLETPDSVGLV
jgi:HisJ family histidinol phosphate phosphatase